MSFIGDQPTPVPTAPESPRGFHLLLEFYRCGRDILTSSDSLEGILREAASLASVHVLQSYFYRFEGGGVTGVLVLAESHLSIHTWPEHRYAAVDFFTCGSGRPQRGLRCLRDGLQAREMKAITVMRGSSSEFGSLITFRSCGRLDTERDLSRTLPDCFF
ncbi:adenosylmethionine decarboxylase [Paraburkholderia lycopersici]|uniref:adenosylmethionine decarboxylase n=1 Tax=Paraburkholderia lycopersici TaxID=416944 RepID=UPI000B88A341|nr:adenosylmethionine decarboxylase [Paraburkholderia lycopersici]